MKYKVSLADNYTLKRPFMCEWNTELIGDKLREEFKTFLDNHKKEIGYREGTSKALLVPPVLQRFMNSKRITMVENPKDGSLISRFVLPIGQTREVDQRAADSLGVFKRRHTMGPDGKFSDWEGFLEIIQVGKTPKEEADEYENPTIVGADLSYFDGQAEEAVEKAEPAIDMVMEFKPELYCEECKKTFTNKGVLAMHMKKHKKATV